MKRKRIHLIVTALAALSVSSCQCSSGTQYVEGDAYWESQAREKELKEMGMENAARMEREARQNYMQGGGYTSPSGGSQVHYNGSTQQQDDLRAIDEYMRTHPDF